MHCTSVEASPSISNNDTAPGEGLGGEAEGGWPQGLSQKTLRVSSFRGTCSNAHPIAYFFCPHANLEGQKKFVRRGWKNKVVSCLCIC